MEPFAIRQQGDILFLGLDSPSSTVNIMTRAAAQQIHDIFDHLKPTDAKLIVFWSRKPYSFLNGAELLLTSHIKSQEDLDRLTRITREAYAKVANSPIPTVAAIEGNCFGCGLEFTLNCDYRVASDSYDTQFYMTELRDYYCLPVFGGMEKLPRLVGVKPSADLLITGETWGAETAKKHRLIDEVFKADRFAEELTLFLENLLKKGPVKKSWPKKTHWGLSENTVEEDERRLSDEMSRMAPALRPLYQNCWNLLRGEPVLFDTASDTFATTLSRAATSFFYVRTMAKVASLGTTSTIPERDVKLILSPSAKSHPFVDLLIKRKLKGLKIDFQKNSSDDFRLEDESGLSHSFRVFWNREERKASGFEKINQPVFYFPEGESLELCEVFLDKIQFSIFKPFLVLLSHLGWFPLVMTDHKVSAVDSLMTVYFDSLDLFVARHGKMEDLNQALWAFGFEKFPFPVSERADRVPIDHVDSVLLNELFITLYRQGKLLLKAGVLKHSSQIDLVMRTVFGYPLIRENFSRWMEKKGMGCKKSESPSLPVLPVVSAPPSLKNS